MEFNDSLPHSKMIHFLIKNFAFNKHISGDSFHTKLLREYKIHFLIRFMVGRAETRMVYTYGVRLDLIVKTLIIRNVKGGVHSSSNNASNCLNKKARKLPAAIQRVAGPIFLYKLLLGKVLTPVAVFTFSPGFNDSTELSVLPRSNDESHNRQVGHDVNIHIPIQHRKDPLPLFFGLCCRDINLGLCTRGRPGNYMYATPISYYWYRRRPEMCTHAHNKIHRVAILHRFINPSASCLLATETRKPFVRVLKVHRGYVCSC